MFYLQTGQWVMPICIREIIWESLNVHLKNKRNNYEWVHQENRVQRYTYIHTRPWRHKKNKRG